MLSKFVAVQWWYHYSTTTLDKTPIKGHCNFFLFSRLAVFDSLFIVDCLIEKSIIPYFTEISPKEPIWYKITFPYFWHPMKGIIRTITIYMMVVISAERYRTVCFPLCKRHVRKLIIIILITINRKNYFDIS